MHQVVTIIVTGLVGSVGWLLRRWLRGERADSVLSRRLKVLRLHVQMRSAGVDTTRLAKLEADLTRADLEDTER
jgi:hypothetical protein